MTWTDRDRETYAVNHAGGYAAGYAATKTHDPDSVAAFMRGALVVETDDPAAKGYRDGYLEALDDHRPEET